MDAMEKPVRRCELCDRETDKYIVILKPDNEEYAVCWTCKERGEKGFFQKRGFRRGTRDGFIPR